MRFGRFLRRILGLWALLAGLISVTGSHAHIVDEDGRKNPEAYFAQPGVPEESAFSATGNLYCGLAGIDVTAQVVIQNDLLLTAAHVFFNPETGRLRANLERCSFDPLFGENKGKHFRIRPETIRIFDRADFREKGFDFQSEYKKDLALVRLDLSSAPETQFHAYELSIAAPFAETGFQLVSAVDGGAKSAYDFTPAMQTCGVRETERLSGMLTLFTDCDIQNHGPSGAGLLRASAGDLRLTGILVGFRGKTPGPYSKSHNATIFVGMTESIRDWISAYSTEIR